MNAKLKSKKKKNSWLPVTALALLAMALFAAYKVFGPNTGSFAQGQYLYIQTGASYDKVLATLSTGGYVRDIKSFKILARQTDFENHIHAGRYKITPGMSNYNIIRLLRSGRQAPVKLVINKLRTRHDFITLISSNLEADSAVLLQMFRDPVYLQQFGLDTNNAMCVVMPDTYEFLWNTSADKAFRKIARNYTRFWDSTRKNEAHKQGLTPQEVIIMASIIDEESNKNDEKPNIASVYLNRIHKGVRLQADPTVKFAIGDFGLRRITGIHIQFQSPYNTYIHTGLPPGPICTPSVQSIEAVLKAPETNYLYFCAKPDFSGYHNFAATYDEQMKNAHLYQQALNARGIH